jgi:hypothetical protein
MRPELFAILREYIIKAVNHYAVNPTANIFDGLIDLMQTNWDTPATSMIELRRNKKTKEKGDLFEHFALLYFKHCYLYKNKYPPKNIWLFKDLPEDVRTKLRLGHSDLGIDIIIELDIPTSGSVAAAAAAADPLSFIAVQAKYRKPNHYKPILI